MFRYATLGHYALIAALSLQSSSGVSVQWQNGILSTKLVLSFCVLQKGIYAKCAVKPSC